VPSKSTHFVAGEAMTPTDAQAKEFIIELRKIADEWDLDEPAEAHEIYTRLTKALHSAAANAFMRVARECPGVECYMARVLEQWAEEERKVAG
jgi:hypothetical protein